MCPAHLGFAHGFKANKRPGPVALAYGEGAHKITVLHRRRALPLAIGIAVIGNPAVGTHPRPGNHPEFGVAFDESGQRFPGHLAALAFFCTFHGLRQWITLGNTATSQRYCMTI